MSKEQRLDMYLSDINDVMWRHWMLKDEYRKMTDEEASTKIMDILNKWAEE